MRESKEETGLVLKNDRKAAGISLKVYCVAFFVSDYAKLCSTPCTVAQGGLAFSTTLQVPTPFAAADVISRDDAQNIEYHYTIVEASASLPSPPFCTVCALDSSSVPTYCSFEYMLFRLQLSLKTSQ